MSTTDFIQAALNDKPGAALDAFAAAIQPKLDAAIADKYDEVANQVFNGSTDVEYEESEQEYEQDMEDNNDV